MNLSIVSEKGIKSSDVRQGDLLVFYKSSGEMTNTVYMICYNEDVEGYYLQNLTGFKKKDCYYKTITDLLISRKNYRIVKNENFTLSIDLKDILDFVFSPF